MAKKKMRENVVIYDDCYQSLETLTDEQYGKVFRAVLKYGFEKIETTDLDPILNVIYTLIILKMQRSQNKYDACVKNGARGGAPTGNSNASKKTTKKQPEIPENQPKEKIKQPKNNQNEIKNNQNEIKNNQNEIKNNQKILKNNQDPQKKQPPETEIETETEKENASFPSDNKIKNIFFLSSSAGQKPKAHTQLERKSLLSENYDYHKHDKFGKAMIEIADILLDLQEYAKMQGEITHNGFIYKAQEVATLIAQKGKQVVDTVSQKIAINDIIENHATYTASILLGN